MGDGSLANIGAWVTKKVPELVGMEEPDLVEFIMGHVRQHAPAGGSTEGPTSPFAHMHDQAAAPFPAFLAVLYEKAICVPKSHAY